MRCIVCKSPLEYSKYNEWLYHCNMCDYYSTKFTVDINRELKEYSLNEENCFSSLKMLQRRNFSIILDILKSLTNLLGKSILVVGCATGFFLELARSYGIDTYGVEPDKKVGSIAMKKYQNIKMRFLDKNIFQNKQFDFIIFNDVFEHIPDLDETLKICKSLMRKGSILIINIPNSDGIIFLFAKVLAKIGITGPWNRIWQKDFPSPHLHYFNCENLSTFVFNYGFRELKRAELNTFSSGEIFGRIFSAGVGVSNIIFAFIIFIINPFLKKIFSRSDCTIFRKTIVA